MNEAQRRARGWSWRRLRRRYGFAAASIGVALVVGLIVGRMG